MQLLKGEAAALPSENGLTEKQKRKLTKKLKKQKLKEEETAAAAAAATKGNEETAEAKDEDADLKERKEKKRLKKLEKRKRKAEEAEKLAQAEKEGYEEVAAEAEQPEEAPKKKKKKKAKSDDENDERRKNGTDGAAVAASTTIKKCFYSPTKQTIGLSQETVDSYLKEHSITISGKGSDGLRPVLKFTDANLDEDCLKCCLGFEKPTPIQSMCWPVVAGGRDVIGIAETGSGKTLAFSVPGLQHLVHRKRTEGRQQQQQKGKKKKGQQVASPMMLVVAPTRELAMQSQEVLEEAGKYCGIQSVCLYGGVAKYEQREALSRGADVIVATPGRLLDLMEEGCCQLDQISFLVLDEADRMLDQGFERAIRQIISATHADRQTCLFSATWPECIRQLAKEFLSKPIKVTIGSEDLAAGKKVQQIVEVVDERARESKLNKLLTKYHKNGNRILIFVLYKKEADRVTDGLKRKGWNCAAIHGDRTQASRTQAVEDFKSGSIPILVATDVAARGLDIPGVEYVLNYSFPLTIEDYVHRIGRTGRAGKSGVSHTFFHAGDKLRAGELVKVLKDSGQPVPEEMNQFDLSIKRKEHKLYGNFGPKQWDGPMKKSTKITFD